MARITTSELIATVADEHSWRSWDTPATGERASGTYAEELAKATTASGATESIVTGSILVEGQQCAVIAGNFDFLAGSIGRESADRILSALDRATSLGLPLLGLPTSGGIRMQEGTPTFLLMAAIAGAVKRHRDAGLPYLVYLRHPTTGGVFASWGSLGDITHGQPGALVGFLGPRVSQGLTGAEIPQDVQTSEGLAAAGVIDAVLAPADWRDEVAAILGVWRVRAELRPQSWDWARTTASMPAIRIPEESADDEDFGAWECVLRSRDPERPGLAELLTELGDSVELFGTHAGEVGQTVRLFLTRLGGVGCVLVGQERGRELDGSQVTPADLRLARRAMRLANRWHLPLVTVIDTQGAELSERAEAGALAGEIARCLADMADLTVPVVSLLLGGGGGGAALALLPGDRVVGASDAWLSPLPPEGAALIKHRDASRAEEMAMSQSITARDLQAISAVDVVVNSPMAADGPGASQSQRLAAILDALATEITALASKDVDLGARAGRWLNLKP